jgi:hypothetical protein
VSQTTIGVEAYPLFWPENKARTPSFKRENSRFETSFAVARDQTLKEIKLLRGRSVVISTNVSLRRDGLPLAGQRNPDDPGVAVYFLDKNGKQKCIACDRYKKVECNIQAISKTIGALRGIDRWGTGDMVEAAFAGFTALPPKPAGPRPWWVVFDCPAHTMTAWVLQEYRNLAMKFHPDRGGSNQQMAELNAAFESFKKERGL